MLAVKVGTAAVNQTPMDWDNNTNNIINAMMEAADENIDLLLFPEMALTGYGCEDAFHSMELINQVSNELTKILDCSQKMNSIICLGLPVLFNKSIFNSVAVIQKGSIRGIVPKQNLAGDGVHYEPRWFKAWKAGQVAKVNIHGRDIPFGDLVFSSNGIKFGFEICEDAWSNSRPGASLARRGVDIILNPSASHFSIGKREVRKRFVIEGSRAFDCAYVYTNLLGCESGRIIYDGDSIFANGGKLANLGHRFSFEDYDLTYTTFDLEANRVHQSKVNSFYPEIDFEVVNLLPTLRNDLNQNRIPEIYEDDYTPEDKFMEFINAETLGLFDYMRKSNSKGFVISLSGGMDSATCALLVYLMVNKAYNTLGVRFFSKINRPDLQKVERENLLSHLLITVYQGTKNSSEETKKAARVLARGVGANHREVEIDAIVEAYTEMMTSAFEFGLTWEEDDLTLQNIQARVRAPGVWMLANKYNYLLLTTSNKSEAAVGYATMDGDTCGGLAPLGGVSKQFIKEFLESVSYYDFMDEILNQTSSAELKPLSDSQSDEEELMPYDILDQIQKLVIIDKKNPTTVFDLLTLQNPQYAKDDIFSWVKKFYQLWSRNQWKRERYAPSFHIDDENLDPKTWCRFPILSGGYKKEIQKLYRHYMSYSEV